MLNLNCLCKKPIKKTRQSYLLVYLFLNHRYNSPLPPNEWISNAPYCVLETFPEGHGGGAWKEFCIRYEGRHENIAENAAVVRIQPYRGDGDEWDLVHERIRHLKIR